ncbi:MAG: hypothetical protein EBS78_10655 [Altererythrobacter sp.]|nr:hypothetical protein [Altererythrobacter sp.]
MGAVWLRSLKTLLQTPVAQLDAAMHGTKFQEARGASRGNAFCRTKNVKSHKPKGHTVTAGAAIILILFRDFL